MRIRCEEGFEGDACLLREATGAVPAEGRVFVYAVLAMTLQTPFATAFETQEARYALQSCERRASD